MNIFRLCNTDDRWGLIWVMTWPLKDFLGPKSHSSIFLCFRCVLRVIVVLNIVLSPQSEFAFALQEDLLKDFLTFGCIHMLLVALSLLLRTTPIASLCYNYFSLERCISQGMCSAMTWLPKPFIPSYSMPYTHGFCFSHKPQIWLSVQHVHLFLYRTFKALLEWLEVPFLPP